MIVNKITVEMKDGTVKTFEKADTKWMMILSSKSEDTPFNMVSLSGDLVVDAFLLKILELAVNMQFSKYNKMENNDARPDTKVD